MVNLDDAVASIREVHGTYEDVAMALEDDDVDKDIDETQVRCIDMVAKLSERMKACLVAPIPQMLHRCKSVLCNHLPLI